MFRAVVRLVRVWLEPGYDHGRCGAWLLDWPGCFTWAGSRDAALDRVPSAVNRFVGWLHANREPTDVPASERAALVEEVEAFRLDDGYEVNATFAADRRPVAAIEVEQAIRWLEIARRDLHDVAARIGWLRAAGSELAPEVRPAEALASGAAPGREVEGVLRHVAGAEAWFATRLDPAARYAGPAAEADLAAHLAGTRAWLVEALRALHRRDPAMQRTDGRGEQWTLAKLLRRAVYHSRDHWDELDRRLAVAERRVERLELRRNAPVDTAELRALFAATGLFGRDRDGDAVTERMIAGSTETVSLWDGEAMVGFGRIVSDEATNAYISTVVVAPAWQERGAGTRLMRALMDGRDGLKLTLDARAGAFPFYERLGFEHSSHVLVRRRQST